jgi:hypothetical protein
MVESPHATKILHRLEALSLSFTRFVAVLPIEAGIDKNRFNIVPFPINRSHLIKYYIPDHACIFTTIYDDWGRHKRDILLSLGYKVEVLWERDVTQKGITSSQIRKLIAVGSEWESLVPKATARLIKELQLEARIRALQVAKESDQKT